MDVALTASKVKLILASSCSCVSFRRPHRIVVFLVHVWSAGHRPQCLVADFQWVHHNHRRQGSEHDSSPVRKTDCLSNEDTRYVPFQQPRLKLH